MSRFDLYEWIQGLRRRSAQRGRGGGGGVRVAVAAPDSPPPPPGGRVRRILMIALVGVLVYGVYFWEIRRVVVPADHVLVLMKKDGSKSLPEGQIVIPRPPDANKEPARFAAWEKEYGDTNGICEQVLPEGTYFGFSPFDYEREVLPVRHVNAMVPNGKVGVVVRKFGKNLPAGHVLADASKDERGPLPQLLYPGRYNEYANPYAYEIKLFDPVVMEPGYEGVVTLMAAKLAGDPNQYLVGDGEQGTQPRTEPPGFRYVNLYEKRITPIDVRSQKFEMSGGEAITFPSSDSFTIRMQGFVEWRIMPSELPRIYVQYGEGSELVPYLESKV
ncbi:MAG TPA: SPFH domain-containing protein, partial [Tepidisphaeraceae bacterium]